MATQTATQRRAAARKAAATRKRHSAQQKARRQAERIALIPVGAAFEARDRVVDAVRGHRTPGRARRTLNRFERRGRRVLA
jgi:hypothetical protein